MSELFNLQTIIVVLAAIASFVGIVGFSLPYLRTDNRAARLKSVARRREELSEQQRSRMQQKSSTRMLRPQQVSFMKRVVDQFKLENVMSPEAVRRRLVQAGHRGQTPLVIFSFVRAALPLALAAIGALFVFGPAGASMQLATKMIVIAGGAVVGFYLPSLVLGNMIQKRQQSLTKGFPDALDLLVICVESGSSMEAAFQRVQEELTDVSPELSEEFGIATVELQYLPDRRSALENLALRTGLGSVKSLTTALIQAEKYGTPLAAALRVLSQENREARMMAAEKKAAALPAKLTVPMIVFFLPVLFIVLMVPAVIKTMATVG